MSMKKVFVFVLCTLAALVLAGEHKHALAVPDDLEITHKVYFDIGIAGSKYVMHTNRERMREKEKEGESGYARMSARISFCTDNVVLVLVCVYIFIEIGCQEAVLCSASSARCAQSPWRIS